MKALKVWGIITAASAGLGVFGCFMEVVNGGRSFTQSMLGGGVFLAGGIVLGGIVAGVMTVVQRVKKKP